MKKISKKLYKYISIITIFLISFTLIYIKGEYRSKETFNNDANVNYIIPKPMSYESGIGEYSITKDSIIYVMGKSDFETNEIFNIAQLFKEKLRQTTGIEVDIVKGERNIESGIYLSTIFDYNIDGNEGYKMVINNKSIDINANKAEGIARAISTLKQLLPAQIAKNTLVEGVKWSIPASTIIDKPEYNYRGFMLDVARHFYTIDDVKRQIDIASQYKINKLHLHLSDDQGWRLEIKKYPDLTIIGGSTEVGGGKGGYYTQDEFKDLVQYAAERYIEIIPEFDMPGHSNAALASYGFLNPDGERKPLYTGIKVGFSTLMTHDEKTYEFIEDVIKEVAVISPSKYIHIGGDEALSTKKEDYNYFVGRVSKIAEKYNKTPIGWDPIDTSPEIKPPVILQNWQDSNTAAREKDMKILISIAKKSYLDMKYNKDTPYGLDWAGLIPVDVAYNWDPTEFAPQNLVLGIEAPLWTETISTVQQMDYMIYPRLIGYAEIGWTPKANRNWEEYKLRLEKQGERLEYQGVNYYKDPSIWKK